MAQSDQDWLQKIVNGVLLAALLGLISWNLMTTQNLAVEVAVMSSQMDSIIASTTGIANMRSTIDLMESRLSRLETWNQNLSTRLASLEEDIRDAAR